MKRPDLCFLTATDLGELLKSRLVSASDVATACLERIDQLNGMLNAFITVRRTEALADAKRTQDEMVAGEYRGPIHGVPIGVKDNIHTAGDLTTAGSKILIDHVSREDAAVVALVRRAGATLLGKQSLMEFAMGDDVNPLSGHGPTLNPWNLSRSASGSSSGSAAAVAAGLCTIALGTDTGGSIRLPAAFCGIVGMKPTFGLVSTDGVIPLAWTLDCVGPMTRSVKDNAVLMRIIAGYDRRERTSGGTAVGDYLGNLYAGVRGLRIGIPRRYFMEYAMPEVATAVDAAAQQLSLLGATVHEVDLPHTQYVVGAWTTIVLAEMSAFHQTYLRQGFLDKYTRLNRITLDLARFVSAADYVNAQRIRQLVVKDFQAAFRQVDVIMTPTAPAEANPIAEDILSDELPIRAPPAGVTSLLEMTCRMTTPANMGGVPALALPVGFSSAGLPLSAQLIGKWFDEETLYRIAFAYEQTTDWHARRPSFVSDTVTSEAN